MTIIRIQLIRGIVCGILLSSGCTQTDKEIEDKRSADKSFSETQDDSADSVSIPVNVSGTYLYCNQQAQTDQTGANLRVECKVATSPTAEKVALDQYAPSWEWAVQRVFADTDITVDGFETEPDDPNHFIIDYRGPDPARLEEIANKSQVQLTLRQNNPNLVNFSATITNGQPLSQLPEDFRIYMGPGGTGPANVPFPQAIELKLPTVNSTYTDLDGCYLACYSSNPDGAVYSVGENIFVKGQYRIKGHYEGRICQPADYPDAQDLGAVPELKQLCSEALDSCKPDECGPGGDTGGWFGIQ
jgi:hypothetical protein